MDDADTAAWRARRMAELQAASSGGAAAGAGGAAAAARQQQQQQQQYVSPDHFCVFVLFQWMGGTWR